MIKRRLTWAVSVAAAALLGAGLWAAAPAGASTGWTVQQVPKPGTAGSTLPGVACVTGGTCTAVGYYRTKNAQGQNVNAPFAVRKVTGSGWTLQTVPEPSGASSDSLWSVSCPSASFCAAVGTDLTTTGDSLPLAEIWDGTSWTAQTLPTPGSVAVLFGVSCSSATACMAVGYYASATTASGTLAESWNGTSWTVVPTGDGLTDASLDAVSCPSASFCAAAGLTNGLNGSRPLAERWDGSAWTVDSVPAPAGVTSSNLQGVSCPSATACTAVGWSGTQTSAEPTALAERWNGTRWKLQSFPAGGSELFSVSCHTATTCTAVGGFSPLQPAPLAAAWNRTSGWALQAAAVPGTAAFSELDGVSCLKAATCTATGHYHLTMPGPLGAPLAEHE